MTDSTDTETTTEYYIVRIFRRSPGKPGEKVSLVGVVEDTEGNREPFRNNKDLLKALAGKLGQDHPENRGAND